MSDPTDENESAELREKVLDLEDALDRLESQHEVLENFCFGLEQEHDRARTLVENTRAELQKSYEALRALKEDQDEIFATVTQGILTINRDGTINPGYSRAAGQILERGDLESMPFVELLPEGPVRAKFGRFLDLQFLPRTQPAMLARLNPLTDYAHSVTTEDGLVREKSLAISFARIWKNATDDSERSVRKVLVVIDDQTTEHELTRELERRVKEQARKVETAYQILMLPPSAYEEFIEETDRGLGYIESSLQTSDVSVESLRKCARTLHTLKGSARALGLDYVQHKTHRMEGLLGELQQGQSTGVVARVLEALNELRERLREGNEMSSRISEMRSTLRLDQDDGRHELERLLAGSIRVEGEACGKVASLSFVDELAGQVPRHFRVRVKNALIQLVRNAVSHGLEASAERAGLGKARDGRIEVRITETEDTIRVSCRDDGRGISAAEIRARALERGLANPEEVDPLDDEQVLELIFLPGFSTAPSVTEASGRGVGMDVVVENAAALGGRVRVDTEVGKHTEFVLELPKRTALAELSLDPSLEHEQ